MSDEWPEDRSPTGGVGTIPRPATPPRVRPGRTHRPGAPSREPKGAPPDDPGAVGGLGREKKKSFGAGSREKQKLPFFLLLCGLLGGALVCALVITTTLAEGSFRITRLQQASASLAKQRQLLREEVAAAQSAQVIQSRARQLGMLPVGQVRFLDLKTGKIQTDAGSGAVADIHVPGYTP
jgi:hypothetical protein